MKSLTHTNGFTTTTAKRTWIIREGEWKRGKQERMGWRREEVDVKGHGGGGWGIGWA